MTKYKYFPQVLFTSVIILLLSGCAPKSNFNPYDHMSRILTMTTVEQFNHDKDEILAHIDPKFHDTFISMLDGTIYDKYYSKSERACYTEVDNNTVKLILEYDCTSVLNNYTEIAYFVYQDDILVGYKIYHVNKNEGGLDL